MNQKTRNQLRNELDAVVTHATRALDEAFMRLKKPTEENAIDEIANELTLVRISVDEAFAILETINRGEG
jgi:hypothetical protein